MTTEAEAFRLPPAEAIRYFGGQVNVGTRRWTDVWKGAHTRAFMVAGLQADDLLQAIRDARDKALREGTTLAEFRRDLAPLLERTGWAAKGRGYVAWRTRLIYETNLRSAYAAGQYEQQTDPDVLALVPIWRYRHSGAKDPRPEHVRWDGLTLRHDDPFWATHYPPNGWGCGCWVQPMTERAAARDGGTRGRDAAGLNKAPEILRRQWTDPASGRTEMVPIGIDPGWDYNVGAAWRSNRDLPTPSTPIPPDAAPPAPALPRLRDAPAEVIARDRELKAAGAAWARGLGVAERGAVLDYKTTAGHAINRMLRGEIAEDPALAETVAALRPALARAVLTRDTVALRGGGAADRAVLAGRAAGDTVRFGWFLSSTLWDRVAKLAVARGGGPLIELRLPAGTRGVAYIHPVPEYRHPIFELLASPGLLWRIVTISDDRVVLEPIEDERGN